jgi:hypothetical protein
MKDLYSITKELVALNPATISSSTTTSGAIIDLQGYEGVMFVLQTGARTDGTYTPLIQEGDDSGLSDAAAVADADLLPSGTGQEASAAIAAANSVSKIGYRGTKRYVRLQVVSTTVTSGAIVGGTAILGFPTNAPIA